MDLGTLLGILLVVALRIARYAFISTCVSRRSCVSIFFERSAIPGIYTLANWKEFSLDLPKIIFVTNDARAISRLISAFAFSLDSFSNTDLNTPLLLSSLPFLCDYLDGLSFTFILCPQGISHRKVDGILDRC